MNTLALNASNEEICQICRKLRLSSIGECVCTISEDPLNQPSAREVAVMLINSVILARNTNKINRALKDLNVFYSDASIDRFYNNHDGLNLTTLKELCCCEWIKSHRNLLLLGPVMSGKTWIGDLLAVKAITCGLKVYRRIFHEFCFKLTHSDSDEVLKFIDSLVNSYDLIYFDNFGHHQIDDEMASLLYLLFEKANKKCSIMITSVVGQEGWQDVFSSNKCGKGNFEFIYCRMTNQDAINIQLKNSYYNADDTNNDTIQKTSSKSTTSSNNFPFDNQKGKKTGQKGKVDKADIKANEEPFEGKNSPKRETNLTSLKGKTNFPSEGSSLNDKVIDLNIDEEA